MPECQEVVIWSTRSILCRLPEASLLPYKNITPHYYYFISIRRNTKTNISSSSVPNLFPTEKQFPRVPKIREINSTGKQSSINEKKKPFLCSIFDGLVLKLQKAMNKSLNFLQNLIKPFKLGSSKGNERNPVPIFCLCFKIWYVPDNDLISVLALLWLIRGTEWRRLGEDCSAGTEVVSLWDLSCCNQRFSPNSQARRRRLWTRFQGKFKIRV